MSFSLLSTDFLPANSCSLLLASILEKAIGPHSSTLAWKIPWMEEPGRLQSMRSLRVRHYWVTSLSLFTFMHWRRKWQPTPVSCLGNPRDGGAWWAAIYGVAQSRTHRKWLSSSNSSSSMVQEDFLEEMILFCNSRERWWIILFVKKEEKGQTIYV